MKKTATADASAGDTAALSLRNWLQTQGYSTVAVESQVRELLDDGGFRSRFTYFMKFFDEAAKEHLLVSGTAVGTEMLVALDYGFEQIAGTEVVPELVEICRSRIAARPRLSVSLYDGAKLPFEDVVFSAILSGHVIEHTRSPKMYLQEHLRVLKKGGFMFLEFPTRHNRIELHTGMLSIEWLPKALRLLIARAIMCRASPFSDRTKRLYGLILETLQPISVLQIWWWSFLSPWKVTIENCSVPAKGIVRMVLRKR